MKRNDLGYSRFQSLPCSLFEIYLVHTISILVVNKPGVLMRVAQVFSRRGFNIDSLVVSSGFDNKYARMTITAQGNAENLTR